MKKLSILFLLLLPSLFLFAQKKTNKYFTDEYGNQMHYDIGNQWSRGMLMMLVDQHTKKVYPINYLRSDNYSHGNFIYLEGTQRIELESRMHKDSLSLYRYTIIENDTNYLAKDAILKKIKFVWNERSDFPNHVTVDLGNVNVSGKKIEVELYRFPKKAGERNRAVIYNKPLKPAEILLCRVASLDGSKTKVKIFKNGDTITNNAATIGLEVAMKSTDVNYIYELTVTFPGKNGIYSTSIWRPVGQNKVVFNLDAQYFKTAGAYEIKITPRPGAMWEKNHWKDTKQTVKMKFTVAKNNEKTFQTKEIIIIGLITAAVFGAIFGASITYIKKKNQKKLFHSQQQKEISKAQLNSIRAQLNPHFMFNALAGIQNLMNQNKTDEANRYLSKFARLTRNVLDQQELISLTEEKELLEDYLQMEQLRFGFTYKIEIHQQIDLNVEIPSMLLQPFVENAIKHGIATKSDKGFIKIAFETRNKDLILSVKDNGIGFDTNQVYQGLGLQLSKNRISLLNTIYTTTPFVLEINADAKGSTIKITLTQWL